MMPKIADIVVDVKRALQEDVGSGDVTALLLPEDLMVQATILSRESFLMCGQPWVDAVFAEMEADIALKWYVNDGDWLPKPQTLCEIRGSARAILTAERTALNFLQTLSGTATQVHHYVQALAGYKTRLLDTRKTLPGLRLAQKYAVTCGGGLNHRLGLYDAFLIKENHIKACGSIKQAVRNAKEMNRGLLIEVEVETLEELQEAWDAKADRVLLDNFTPEMLCTAVMMNQPKHCELEASGGIDLTTLKRVAETGVDYISVGSMTKSVRAIDLSLLIQDVEP